MHKKALVLLLVLAINFQLKAQSAFEGIEHLFTTPKNYIVRHTNEPLKIDGNLQETAWQNAPWTTEFVDIEGSLKPLPALRTQVKMLWNDTTLFIAAKLQEPQIWATQTHHDDIIFKDNDFEVFINPANNAHQYFEVEVNAINKIFDLFLSKAYRNGGNALVNWDLKGLKSAVKINGTLNNPNDQDQSWTVEMAIPIKSILFGFAEHMPQEGTLWRINFSRVEWDTKNINGKNVKLTSRDGKNLPEHNWVWSPQGVIDMHYPERWGYLQFTRTKDAVFRLPYAEQQGKYLWLIYYRQKQFFEKTGKYAADLDALGIKPLQTIEGEENQLKLLATDVQFTAIISDRAHKSTRINDEGLIKTDKSKP